MNIYSFASLAAFIICLFLGLFVYWKDKVNPINRSFAVATIFMGTWSLFPFLTSLTDSEAAALFWTRTIYIFAFFTPPTFLHFILIFVGVDKKRPQKQIILGSYIAILGFLAIGFNPDFIKGVIRLASHYSIIPGPLYFLFILFFGILCPYTIFEAFFAYQKSAGYQRNQLRYLFFAFVFAFLGGIIHFLAAYIGREYFPHDFLIIAYSAVMAYAIVAHRLMDVNIVLTRGLAYGGITMIIAGAYIGLMAGVDKFFAGVPGYNPAFAHSLLFILVLFALIYVLPQMKIRAIEISRKTLFRGRYDYQQELSEAARVIPTMLNLERLGDYILNKIKDTMLVDKLALFVFNEAERTYRALASFELDKEALAKIKIGENTALAGLLRDTGTPLVKEELKRIVTVPAETTDLAVEQLTSLGAELCVPLMLRDDLTGILTLGNKSTKEMYTDEDLSLLITLTNQVALTIEYIKAIDKISGEKRYVGLGKASMRMAHDIKNPLVPLKTFLQILPDKYPKEFAQMGKIDPEFTGRFYQSALEGVDRINLLIERALRYARHPEPIFSRINLDKLLDDVLTQEDVEMKKAKVQLEKHYSPSCDGLQADGEQLIELFSNLIANGIDAMEESPTRRLTIKTQALDTQVIIEISDTGCGISKDKIDTIFDPFITYKHKGSGLGLAIVKKIVDDHKGNIDVSSEPDKGTTFRVALPRKQ